MSFFLVSSPADRPLFLKGSPPPQLPLSHKHGLGLHLSSPGWMDLLCQGVWGSQLSLCHRRSSATSTQPHKFHAWYFSLLSPFFIHFLRNSLFFHSSSEATCTLCAAYKDSHLFWPPCFSPNIIVAFFFLGTWSEPNTYVMRWEPLPCVDRSPVGDKP